MIRQSGTLVPLTSEGGTPPLFLASPLTGTVQCYLELARAAPLPCIGLAARGVDGKEQPWSCVESMAASYIQEVREHSPVGPYDLAGWSFGGLVAYEMALQLSRMGLQVRLTLLDSHPPNRIQEQRLDEVSVLAQLCQELARSADARPPSAAELRPLGPHIALDHVLSWATQARVLGGDCDAVHALLAVFRASLRALQRYKPSCWAGPVHLVRAATEEGKEDSDPTLGWGRLCQPEVSTVSGDHYSMLRAPNVASIAEHMAQSARET